MRFKFILFPCVYTWLMSKSVGLLTSTLNMRKRVLSDSLIHRSNLRLAVSLESNKLQETEDVISVLNGVSSTSPVSDSDKGITSKGAEIQITKDPRDLYLKLELDLGDFFAFFGRVVDTVDDSLIHFRRAWEPAAKKALNIKRDLPTPEGPKPRLVLLGTGWGGHALVKIIEHEKYDVVVVSPRNCFVFTPLLAACAVGTVDTTSITESIKQANPHVTYVQGTVSNIDIEKRFISIKTYSGLNEDNCAVIDNVKLAYSKLVYAVGTKTGTFGVKGVRENCFFLKEVGDARRLRRALLRSFDEASFPGVDDDKRRTLLSFVIIGSGPTGIEFAGELGDLLRTDVPRLFPDLIPFISLQIISGASTILPMFDQILQEKGLATLAASGANVMLNAQVTEIQPGLALLKSGKSIPFGLCFWAGGTEPRQLTLDMIDQIQGQNQMIGQKRGQLTVDPFMRVKGVPDGSFLGIGDAVRVDGENYPTTGQVAAQQGAYVARLLNREYILKGDGPPKVRSISDKPSVISAEMIADWFRLRGDLMARPFHFLNLGVMAYLGSGSGLAQIEGGERSRLLDASGKVGFFLWRSIYVVKQVSVRNRVCVLIDWFKARAFGRDFTSPAEYSNSED